MRPGWCYLGVVSGIFALATLAVVAHTTRGSAGLVSLEAMPRLEDASSSSKGLASGALAASSSSSAENLVPDETPNDRKIRRLEEQRQKASSYTSYDGISPVHNIDHQPSRSKREADRSAATKRIESLEKRLFHVEQAIRGQRAHSSQRHPSDEAGTSSTAQAAGKITRVQMDQGSGRPPPRSDDSNFSPWHDAKFIGHMEGNDVYAIDREPHLHPGSSAPTDMRPLPRDDDASREIELDKEEKYVEMHPRTYAPSVATWTPTAAPTNAPTTTTPSKVTAAPWSYSHRRDWDVSGYRQCGGVQQSPVNIETSAVSQRTKSDLVVKYRSGGENWIRNTGHAIIIDSNGFIDDQVVFENVAYTLLKVELHEHSEHTIDGVAFPLEVQFVHRDQKGNLLIMAVLFKMDEHRLPQDNAALDALGWNDLPRAHNTSRPSGAFFSTVASLLPSTLTGNSSASSGHMARAAYYSYSGSLTSPPCTEGVKWLVLTEHPLMSPEQAQRFPLLGNFRPLQALNGRHVSFLSGPKRTFAPSHEPTVATAAPSFRPSAIPTQIPTTVTPSVTPTASPTVVPTASPTTRAPTLLPTKLLPPTQAPSLTPTDKPSHVPSLQPTTLIPTTRMPTNEPITGTAAPTPPTDAPTALPSTPAPSLVPTDAPTLQPSLSPSNTPTDVPTFDPTTHAPTDKPTVLPTLVPTEHPSTLTPTGRPSFMPTQYLTPTMQPTTWTPTATPTVLPTAAPTSTLQLHDIKSILNTAKTDERLLTQVGTVKEDATMQHVTEEGIKQKVKKDEGTLSEDIRARQDVIAVEDTRTSSLFHQIANVLKADSSTK